MMRGGHEGHENSIVCVAHDNGKPARKKHLPAALGCCADRHVVEVFEVGDPGWVLSPTVIERSYGLARWPVCNALKIHALSMLSP
jgi:hypothetical protein